MARNDSQYAGHLANQMWKKRIEAIKNDIKTYWMDCNYSEDATECKMCNKVVFESILKIIDKHTKGD